MPMLELHEQRAKLVNINLRDEKHGDENHAAADLRFDFVVPNDFLSELSPSLKFSLYQKDESQDDLLKDQAHFTKLRLPGLKSPLKWEFEGIGYTVTIPVGVSGKENITIGDCKVNKLQISPMDGGTVIVSVRVQCSPTPAQFGQLSALLSCEVDLTLTAPEASDESSDTGPLFGKADVARAEAESLFHH